MKWLKSTTSKAYTACGKIIPAMSNPPVAVNESDYQQMTSMAVIKSLIKTGGIIVLDKYTEHQNISDAATQRLQALTAENERLADNERALEARATDAEQKLAELQAKYAELETEANQKIASLASDLEKAQKKASAKGKEDK